MLAGELALAGVDVAIVERRSTPDLVGSRAGGFHSRMEDGRTVRVVVTEQQLGSATEPNLADLGEALRAHIHSAAGGQGIGLGVQDAVNLGWKLAQVVKGISPDVLLDSYHAEQPRRAAQAARRSPVRTRCRVRPRRGTPFARAPDARP